MIAVYLHAMRLRSDHIHEMVRMGASKGHGADGWECNITAHACMPATVRSPRRHAAPRRHAKRCDVGGLCR